MALRRISLGLQAYEALKAMILDGRFPPGARIKVEQVAKELGVSRTPVWEAVAHLAREGLVVNLPHRGVHVAVLTAQDILDLYAVRDVIEALAASLAAQRMTPATLERMDACLAAQDAVLAGEDLAAYSALDAEFHALVCEQCGNRHLQEMLHSIRDKIWPLRAPIRPILPQLVDGHRQLLEALRAGQSDRAAAIIHKHTQLIMETIGNGMENHAC